MRDPVAAVVEANRRFTDAGRDPTWLRQKLDRLCASPFGLLRGTFHLFVADWAAMGDDPFGPGEPQPVVGDLHLENFGAFKASDGSFVFDVNDFDETGLASPALDLARVAASCLLADERRGPLEAVPGIGDLVAAYLQGVRSQDLRPLTSGTELPSAVRRVIELAEKQSRAEWLESRAEGTGKNRRFRESEKYRRVPDTAERKAVEEGVLAWAASCPERPADCPSWPRVLDVAVRIAGTGSLGRFRYAILLPGKGEKAGKELVVEFKEALPSSLDPQGTSEAQAARVIAHQRQLQGASPAYLGTATIGGRAFTVRELQPTEGKIDPSRLKTGEADALRTTCGQALGRLHRRGAYGLPARLTGRDRALGRRIAAFALRYAEVVTEDHALLVARRREVESALGLTALS